MSRSNSKVLALVGPTASGKTKLAYTLAKQFNGEIVSADSRQVYKQLDIGTGKEGLIQDNAIALAEKYPLVRYIDNIPQWLTDFLDPNSQFTVADYQQRAYEVIDDIIRRGKLPIVVGGSGLYITALIEGYRFSKNTPRQRANPRHAADKSPNNPPRWEVLILGIALPRAELYRAIDGRLEKRLKQGLVEEAQSLIEQGISPNKLRQFGLEYRFLADLLEHKLNYEEFKQELQLAIHAFARRQLTWFRHHGLVQWISSQKEAIVLTQAFLLE